MAIRSEKELKKSSAIAIVWVVLSLGFTIAIGLLGRAFLYPEILGVQREHRQQSQYLLR